MFLRNDQRSLLRWRLVRGRLLFDSIHVNPSPKNIRATSSDVSDKIKKIQPFPNGHRGDQSILDNFIKNQKT